MSPAKVPPIGSRIRAERTRRGLTVRGLARNVGVSPSLISQIETDKSKPSVSTLYAITTALGMSLADLVHAAAPLNGDSPAEPLVGQGFASTGAPGSGFSGAGPIAGLALPGAGEVVTPGPSGAGPIVGPELPEAGEVAVPGLPGAGQMATAGLSSLLAANGGAVRESRGPTGRNVTGQDRERAVGPLVTPVEREVIVLDSGVTWDRLGQVPGQPVDFLLVTYQPGGTSSSSGELMRHNGFEYGYLISGELTLRLGFDEHHLAAGDAVSFSSSTPHGYRNDGTVPAVGVWLVLDRD